MSHYYDKEVTLKSEPQKFDIRFENETFTFITDNGVFSKGYLDFGSYNLIKSFKPADDALNVLDLCSGYGPVGIILKRLYPHLNVYLTEINERAYELSINNSRLNKTEVNIYNGNLFEALPKDILFDHILVNPPIRAGKNVVFACYDGAFNKLKVNGSLYVVIQKKQGAPSTIKHLEELYGNCEVINKEKGYYILRSIKNE